VLIVHDVYGRTPFYESLAARLATAGFTTLLPDFFFREGPLSAPTRHAASERRNRADSRRMLSDGLSAADWLNEKHLGRLGTVGFCMGGNYVLAMASERDHLSTVCFYGFPGRPIHFTQDEPARLRSTWFPGSEGRSSGSGATRTKVPGWTT
jgi:carboxymethylenebutenolidase